MTLRQTILNILQQPQGLLFLLSVGLLVAGIVVLAVLGLGRKKLLGFTASQVFTLFFFLATLVCLFAAYYHSLPASDSEITYIRQKGWESFLAALQHTMRLFVLDGDYRLFTIDVAAWGKPLSRIYAIYGGFLYLIAPLTTFTFLLTFFKNLKARFFYFLSRIFGRKLHIFSELNESTVALAKSLRKQSHWDAIVFTDVTDKKEEENMELIEKAQSIGAILFRRDLEDLNHGKHRSLERTFYLISEDEAEKLRHARHIIEKYDRENTTLYLFSDSVSTKTFIESLSPRNAPEGTEAKEKNLRIIRINDIRFLIYNELDQNGLELFRHAKPVGEKRVISAVIVGLGRYGRELLKALLWYCQMPGYELHVTAFDENPDAESRIRTFCPGGELESNGVMRYKITVHSVRTGTMQFEEKLKDAISKDRMTYGFVCLGDDETNLAVATDLCLIAGRQDCYPIVKAIVYNSGLAERLSTLSSVGPAKKPDTPHIIGDIDSFYSTGTVLNSELIDLARNIHTSWNTTVGSDAEKTFYRSDYCFFSSVSKALHRRLRQKILQLGEEELAPIFPAFAKPAPGRQPNLYREALEFIRTDDKAKKFAEDMTVGSQYMYFWLAKRIYATLSKEQRTAAWSALTKLVKSTLREENINALQALQDRRASEGDGFWTDSKFIPQNKEERTVLATLFEAACLAISQNNSVTDRAKAMKEWGYENLSADAREKMADALKPHLRGYAPERIFTLCYHTARVEHVRWMSYMLTEGYVQTDALNKKRKFDQHITLVPTDELTLLDWVKDT